jgi:amino acid efflux transporter
MACVAVVLCVGMLALAVRSLLPALLLAIAAVAVTLVQRHRARAPVE